MPETTLTERWKWIPGFEDVYKVSDRGRVYSVRRPNTKGGLLRERINRYGYATVALYEDGTAVTKTIHRLVAQVFTPNFQNKSQVNHINGNKLDNSAINLEWSTPSENIKHAFKTGLKNQFGERNPCFKGWIVGVNTSTGETVRMAGKADIKAKGFIQTAVSRCVHGKQKIHKGFSFYLESVE